MVAIKIFVGKSGIPLGYYGLPVDEYVKSVLPWAVQSEAIKPKKTLRPEFRCILAGMSARKNAKGGS